MDASTSINRADALRGRFAAAGGAELPDWGTLEAGLRLTRVGRGGTVFAQDVEHPFLYVVRSGLVKLVYLDAEGGEWIKSFIAEGGFFASVAALVPGGRTTFAAVALEPTELERIPMRVLAALAERELAWSRAVCTLLLAFATRKEQRERELLTLSASERYRAFVAGSPGLAARVPQKDLARHLGVTPVGLNRIVQRVRREAMATAQGPSEAA